MARAKTLKFTGKYDASGQPDRWFTGIPARDLDVMEVKGLSDEEYANITGGDSPLYVDAAAKTAAKAPATKPKATPSKAAPPAKKAAPKSAASGAAEPAGAAGGAAVEAAPAPAP